MPHSLLALNSATISSRPSWRPPLCWCHHITVAPVGSTFSYGPSGTGVASGSAGLGVAVASAGLGVAVALGVAVGAAGSGVAVGAAFLAHADKMITPTMASAKTT